MPSSSSEASTSADPDAAGASVPRVEGERANKKVHLVVAIHGLWGAPANLKSLLKILKARHAGEFSPREADAEAADAKEGSKKPTSGHPSPALSRSASATTTSTKASDTASVTSGRRWLEGAIAESQALAQQAGGQRPAMVILNTATSEGAGTYDGIDWIAERVIIEIKREIKRLESIGSEVRLISILGYSLGGLTARFVVGQLEASGFFTGPKAVEAINFATFATPHLGIPPAGSSFGRLANYIGGRLLGRTGRQLYNLDSGWEEDAIATPLVKHSSNAQARGVIEALSDPSSAFIRGLQKFRKIDFYANAVNDMTVPSRSGLIEPWDVLDEWNGECEVSLDAQYPILITGVKPPADGERKSRPWSLRLFPKTFPIFLNPNRYPMPRPLNYVIFIFLPVLFPTFLCLVLFRFARESRRSSKRVKRMQERWREGKEPDEDPQKSWAELLLRRKVREVAEENVGEDSANSSATTSTQLLARANSNGAVEQPTQFRSEAAKRYELDAHPSTFQVALPEGKRKSPALSAAQLRMCKTLNDPKVLPHLRKHRIYIDGVTNTHAVIICRLPSIALHRRGLPTLQHFADHFALE